MMMTRCRTRSELEMPLEYKRIYRIEDVITAINNGQIAIEPSVDSDIGVKAFGYKDGDGNVRKCLVKDGGATLNSLSMSGDIDMNSNDITDVNLVDGVDVSDHAERHKTGGADEIDGDRLDIDWDPSNYTPATVPAEADSVDNLTAHLYGIDQAIGAAGGGTLDDAYDYGGAGAGRIIDADNGPVEISNQNADNTVLLNLDQNDSSFDPDVLTISNAGTGHCIRLSGGSTQDVYGINLLLESSAALRLTDGYRSGSSWGGDNIVLAASSQEWSDIETLIGSEGSVFAAILAASSAGVSGLTPAQVLYGDGDGTIEQDAALSFDDASTPKALTCDADIKSINTLTHGSSPAAAGFSSNTITVDWTDGHIQAVELTAHATTLTISNPPPGIADDLTLIVGFDNNGNWEIGGTTFSDVWWEQGADLNNTSGKINFTVGNDEKIILRMTYDGTNYYGFYRIHEWTGE